MSFQNDVQSCFLCGKQNMNGRKKEQEKARKRLDSNGSHGKIEKAWNAGNTLKI